MPMNFLNKFFKPRAATGPNLVTAAWQDGREAARPANFNSLIAANKHWVYVCAQKNAAAVASARLRLYSTRPPASGSTLKAHAVGWERKDNLAQRPGLAGLETKGLIIEEVEEHPFLTLMNEVNPFMGLFSLLESTQLNLELTGNAYWWVARNAFGVPVQVWVLPSQNVAINASSQSFIESYAYHVGASKTVLPAAEVIHFKFPNPANLYYGASPLSAVTGAYNIFENMASFENALFTNMARPEGVLTTDQNLNRAEVENLREMWAERYGGVESSGRVAVLAGGLKYQNITMTPRELSFLSGRRLLKEEICAAYGVPLSKVTTENVNLANAVVGEEQYMRDTIKPRLWRVEEKLNESLLKAWGPNLFVAFDDPSPRDREYELKRAETGLRLGYLTINEARGREGLSPVPWGDAPMQSLAKISWADGLEESKE